MRLIGLASVLLWGCADRTVSVDDADVPQPDAMVDAGPAECALIEAFQTVDDVVRWRTRYTQRGDTTASETDFDDDGTIERRGEVVRLGVDWTRVRVDEDGDGVFEYETETRRVWAADGLSAEHTSIRDGQLFERRRERYLSADRSHVEGRFAVETETERPTAQHRLRRIQRRFEGGRVVAVLQDMHGAEYALDDLFEADGIVDAVNTFEYDGRTVRETFDVGETNCETGICIVQPPDGAPESVTELTFGPDGDPTALSGGRPVEVRRDRDVDGRWDVITDYAYTDFDAVRRVREDADADGTWDTITTYRYTCD